MCPFAVAPAALPSLDLPAASAPPGWSGVRSFGRSRGAPPARRGVGASAGSARGRDGESRVRACRWVGSCTAGEGRCRRVKVRLVEQQRDLLYPGAPNDRAASHCARLPRPQVVREPPGGAAAVLGKQAVGVDVAQQRGAVVTAQDLMGWAQGSHGTVLALTTGRCVPATGLSPAHPAARECGWRAPRTSIFFTVSPLSTAFSAAQLVENQPGALMMPAGHGKGS